MASFNAKRQETVSNLTKFQNLYSRLNKMWLKKSERRDFTSDCFKVPYNDVVFNTANMLNTLFKEMNNETSILVALNKKWIKYRSTQIYDVVFKDNMFWFYDMRKSDSCPRTQNDYERAGNFMDFIIEHFVSNEEDKIYLRKNMNISTSFMIWYFTTPNYYYIDNITKHSCRHGNVKTWKQVLYNKKPKEIKHFEKKEYNKYKNMSFLDESKIPNQQKKVNQMFAHLEKELGVSLIKGDNYVNHSRISDLLKESRLGANKYKRLNKYYQEYQKENKKLISLVDATKLKKNFVAFEREDGKLVTFKQIRPKNEKNTEEAVVEEVAEVTTATGGAAEEVDVPDDWENAIV